MNPDEEPEEPDELIPIFAPNIPPPKCKPGAHVEWRGDEDGFWICIDDSEWEAVVTDDQE